MANACSITPEILMRITGLERAMAASPADAGLQVRLAEAYLEAKRWNGAIAAAQAALGLDPNLALARSAMVLAQAKIRELNDAVVRHVKAATRPSRARILECLFGLGQRTEYAAFLKRFAEIDPTNIRAAAAAALVAHQWNIENSYPFCREPLCFVQIKDARALFGDFAAFERDLVREISSVNPLFEPAGKTTIQGYQTAGNLFERPGPVLAKLEAVLRAEIAAYVAARAGEGEPFISRWPADYRLNGWHVRLVKAGHQRAHIHSSGWLSGVLYLRIPAQLPGDEGAIRFSLWSEEFPILRPEIPALLHHPKAGELALFPSSLYHETVPFAAQDERHSLAFDVEPVA